MDLLAEAARAWEGFDTSQLLAGLQQELLLGVQLCSRAGAEPVCEILAQVCQILAQQCS